MIELRASVTKKKRIIALVDNEVNHGGLRISEVKAQLLEADSKYSKWGFDDDGPRGEKLFEALFEHGIVEWNRIGAFQECADAQRTKY